MNAHTYYGSQSGTAPAAAVSADSAYFYQVLGVSYDSTIQDIKSAYRKLAKQLHPDASGNTDTTAMFQTVNRAYEVVLEEGRKRQEEQQQQQERLLKRQQEERAAQQARQYYEAPAPAPYQQNTWSATTNRYTTVLHDNIHVQPNFVNVYPTRSSSSSSSFTSTTTSAQQQHHCYANTRTGRGASNPAAAYTSSLSRHQFVMHDTP